MSKEKTEDQNIEETLASETEDNEKQVSSSTDEQPVDQEQEDENNEQELATEEEQDANKELQEAKDKYLRLYSEFENYRRRTIKERLELTRTATEDLMVELLPVLDDFKRASRINNSSENDQMIEGYQLIENKLSKALEAKGLKKMEIKQGDDFDTEIHEAVSQMPAPKKKLKGKVIEVVEDGYFLGEKVIRFAKVVIGS